MIAARLSVADENEIVLRAQQGDRDALNHLLDTHCNCLWKFVRSTKSRCESPEDLYQIACVGFMKAVAKFDVTRGYRFITFLSYVVPRTLWQEANQAGVIRLPKSGSRNNEAVYHVRSMNDAQQDRLQFRGESPMDQVARNEMVEHVHECLRFIDPRGREVLLRRANGETLGTIGDSLGICKERVRQIEARATQAIRERLTERIPAHASAS